MRATMLSAETFPLAIVKGGVFVERTR